MRRVINFHDLERTHDLESISWQFQGFFSPYICHELKTIWHAISLLLIISVGLTALYHLLSMNQSTILLRWNFINKKTYQVSSTLRMMFKDRFKFFAKLEILVTIHELWDGSAANMGVKFWPHLRDQTFWDLSWGDQIIFTRLPELLADYSISFKKCSATEFFFSQV